MSRGGRTSIKKKKKSLRGFLKFIISVFGELAYWHPLQAAAPLLAETVPPCSISVCRWQVVAVLVPLAVGEGGGVLAALTQCARAATAHVF